VPRLALDKAAVERLERGYPVKKQIQAAGRAGGRGIVVQDVHAPASVVMDRILDFDNYNKMVPNVAQCGNYAKRKLMHVSGLELWRVRDDYKDIRKRITGNGCEAVRIHCIKRKI
jgi:hypothetical protein